jgi:hypothetical protein
MHVESGSVTWADYLMIVQGAFTQLAFFMRTGIVQSVKYAMQVDQDNMVIVDLDRCSAGIRHFKRFAYSEELGHNTLFAESELQKSGDQTFLGVVYDYAIYER